MAEKELILITGANGRIGFKTAERFCRNYRIVGFDLTLAGELPDVEFMIVDIGSDESVKEGVRKVKEQFGGRIASVVHLAAYYNFSGGGWGSYERITVQGTQRLLRALQSCQVDQFIFSSTMLVHAPCKVGEKINEDWPLLPKWNYPKSKVLTEEIIKKERGNIHSVNLRIAGVYDDMCHSIPISNQIQRIYENQLEGHLFPGDITHGATFVHMDDVINALWLAVQKRKELPQELTLLIGEPKTLSYDELQREISQLLTGKEWKTYVVPKWFAKMGAWVQDHIPGQSSFIKPWMIAIADDHYEMDISRAKKFLGWQPKHSIKDSLPVMLSALKRDPRAWYDENKLRFPKKLKQKK